MTAKLENLGLYNIDVNYLEYLHSIDSEVQFSLEKDYSQKPFLGILVLQSGRMRGGRHYRSCV